MKYLYRCILIICAVFGITAVLCAVIHNKTLTIKNYTNLPRTPDIRPDYAGLIMPPNITSLNFEIREPGKKYFVRIRGSAGRNIEIVSGKPQIIIPLKKWRTLMAANRGSEVFYDIYVSNEKGEWLRYQAFSNRIAEENIDSYLVYRFFKPTYNWWRNIGLYQRNLENFDECAVIHGESFEDGCVNCHTFLNNDPQNMLFGVRSPIYGSATMFVDDGKANKIGTQFGHTSWHPSGKLAAFSIYRVKQFFHSLRPEVRDVVELDSGILYYDFRTKTVKTASALTDKEILETHPAWSPDGRYLYFVSTPVLWKDRYSVPPENYEKVQYDLMRISYDIDTDQWGPPETVLSSDQTGQSILYPKISPDGRFILLCMCKYSCFPLYQPDSNLYIMDTQTGKYHDLGMANSSQAEGWQGWSSNSRWIVFSTKRPEGVFTRLYISYIDHDGKASKAFILPQENPAFYVSQLKTYSVPAFITEPIPAGRRTLEAVVRSQKVDAIELPVTGATKKAATFGPAQMERE